MLMTTDTGLVRRAASGDADAFATLYEQSVGPVYAFALHRTGERGAAEDLTRRILAEVVVQLDAYAGEVPFAAWLLGIAKRVAPRSGPAGRKPAAVPPPGTTPVSHGAPR